MSQSIPSRQTEHGFKIKSNDVYVYTDMPVYCPQNQMPTGNGVTFKLDGTVVDAVDISHDALCSGQHDVVPTMLSAQGSMT